jgi:hypothetical protein
LYRIVLATAFAIGTVASFSTFASVAIAAPIPSAAQITNDEASPIIQADHRCGPHRHYVPRHRVRGHDGHLHWIGGVCVHN